MATKANKTPARKNDYSRFYALLKRHPDADKEELVSQFTGGRTTHVSGMSREEFTALCDSLQYGNEREQTARNIALKRARSAALLRIGRLGISTIDNWEGINAFVSSPRIAGKRFYDLGVDELNALVSKLESIIRKGGLKAREAGEQQSGNAEAQEGISVILQARIRKEYSNNNKILN